MTPQRRQLTFDAVPDQVEALRKALANDHAAGNHVIPLFKCNDCRADPEYHAKRKAAEALPAQVAGTVAMPTYIKPHDGSVIYPANPTNVRPRRRSTKLPVPPVVEQPSLSEALQADLEPLPERVVPRQTRVQTTRMLKLVCPVDGYTVRTTRRWIEFGLPYCPGDPAMRHGGDWYDAIHELEEVTK